MEVLAKLSDQHGRGHVGPFHLLSVPYQNSHGVAKQRDQYILRPAKYSFVKKVREGCPVSRFESSCGLQSPLMQVDGSW